jgi:3-oxoacyl-[acyl-carrier protein] reductase
VQGDVAKPADVRRIFAETGKAFGRLEVLVNSAGVYQLAPLGEITEEQFHRQFNTNVLGTILASQEAAKYFNGAPVCPAAESRRVHNTATSCWS